MLSCAGRLDYAVLGPAMELAWALCDVAEPGQILLTAAVGAAVAGMVDVALAAPLSRRAGPETGAILQVRDGRPLR
jgi:class 3 adenylate cyclase